MTNELVWSPSEIIHSLHPHAVQNKHVSCLALHRISCGITTLFTRLSSELVGGRNSMTKDNDSHTY